MDELDLAPLLITEHLALMGSVAVYPIMCERNGDAVNDHTALRARFSRGWCIDVNVSDWSSSRLSRPQVTDGVKETEAPPQLLGGGDITKEALTASCDIAEQTAGPRWAWENSIMVPRRIDGETEAQSEPCVEQRVSTSICTENATFYHVRQLSQAVSDPHEWTRCCGSAHKSASHPGDKTCWHSCRSSAEPLCFGWALNTVTLTPSAIIRLQKFRQTLAFLWGWSWKHCVNPQNSFVICKLSHLPLQQRRFITYIH